MKLFPVHILTPIVALFLIVMASPFSCDADESTHVVAEVGAWPGFSRGFAEGIAVTNGYAYVADWFAGLQIIDVKDPLRPRWVGQYDTRGEARAVAVGGHYAYLADGSGGLVVVDISLPSQPRLVAQFDSGGDARGIRLEGSHAYLADQTIGLIVFDIENPERPRRVGVYFTSGARDVAIVDQYAYLTHWFGGVEVLDLREPANPVSVTRLDPDKGQGPSYARGITRVGQWVFVAARQNGLWVFDVSNPSKPVLASKTPTGGAAECVTVDGQRAYVAASFGGVQVFDVSNPQSPQLLGVHRNNHDTEALAVDRGFIFVASELGGFYVLDAKNAARLEPVAAQIPYGISHAVAPHDGVAYLADGTAGLQVLDISDVHEPRLLARLPSEEVSYCANVKRLGHHLVLLNPGSGLSIVDVSKPTSPRMETRVPLEHAPVSIELAGSAAIVAHAGIPGHPPFLQWVDLRNPAEPILKGAYQLPYQVAAMAANSNWVVVALASPSWDGNPCPGRCVQVLDWTDMRNPRLVDSYDPPFPALSVAANERWVLLGTIRGGLQVLEIMESGKLREHASIQIDEGNDAVATLSLDGDWVWAQHGKRFSAFDLTDPRRPRLLAQRKLDLNGRLTAHGDLAMVAGGDSGLSILRLDQPLPRLIGAYRTDAPVHDVAVMESTVYLGTSSGVEIVDVRNPEKMELISRTGPGPVSRISAGQSFVLAAIDGESVYGWRLGVAHNLFDSGAAGITGVRDVQVHQDLLLVADDRFGLQIFNWSSGHPIQRLGTYVSQHEGRALAASGAYAYLADADAGLQIIDISDPRQPRRTGTFDTPDRARGVAVTDGMAYVADDEAGLHIIDVSKPAAPRRLGGLPTLGEAIGVAVEGGYAYVACGETGLDVIDVTHPSAPRRVGQQRRHPAHAVATSAGRVFVAAGTEGLLCFESYRPEIRLARPVLKPDGAQLAVRVRRGHAARIERSENLIEWTEVRRLPGTGDSAVVFDPGTNLSSRQFYRVREEP